MNDIPSDLRARSNGNPVLRGSDLQLSITIGSGLTVRSKAFLLRVSSTILSSMPPLLTGDGLPMTSDVMPPPS